MDTISLTFFDHARLHTCSMIYTNKIAVEDDTITAAPLRTTMKHEGMQSVAWMRILHVGTLSSVCNFCSYSPLVGEVTETKKNAWGQGMTEAGNV